MKPLTIFKVQTRLSALALHNGGLTVGEALDRAGAALEGLRLPCQETIDVALAEIEARFGAAAAARDQAPFADLDRLASRIVDASIFLREVDLDRAARALCRLTRLCEQRGAWDWVAVELHIDALRLLRTLGPAISAQAREEVLTGLAHVTRKLVGDPETLPP